MPRAFASYERADTIPRSSPVTTGNPFSFGFFAISTPTKKASPSICRIVFVVRIVISFLATYFLLNLNHHFIASHPRWSPRCIVASVLSFADNTNIIPLQDIKKFLLFCLNTSISPHPRESNYRHFLFWNHANGRSVAPVAQPSKPRTAPRAPVCASRRRGGRGGPRSRVSCREGFLPAGWRC